MCGEIIAVYCDNAIKCIDTPPRDTILDFLIVRYVVYIVTNLLYIHRTIDYRSYRIDEK